MRRMYSKPQLLEAVEQEAEVNGLKAFENIVDKDGHKRFIEGTITPETISGFTFEYTRWSLSGSHLLIVVAGTIADATTIADNTRLCKITFPKWINDKIYDIFVPNIDIKTAILYGEDASSQTTTARFRTINTTEKDIIIRNGLTTTAKRMFRIAFDLLIDNE